MSDESPNWGRHRGWKRLIVDRNRQFRTREQTFDRRHEAIESNGEGLRCQSQVVENPGLHARRFLLPWRGETDRAIEHVVPVRGPYLVERDIDPEAKSSELDLVRPSVVRGVVVRDPLGGLLNRLLQISEGDRFGGV